MFADKIFAKHEMNWQDIYYGKSDITHKLHWQKDKKLTAKDEKRLVKIFVRAHNNIEWKINFPLGFDFGWLNNVESYEI